MRRFRFVLGSIFVYLFVACASAVMTQPSGSSNPDASTNGSTTGNSSGSILGDSSSLMSMADAVIDAVTDPVSTASADQPTSGTRLKAQWYVGSDGSKAQAGWYDSQLQVNCGFETASDGTTRCLPQPTPFAATAAEPVVAATGVYYADSACTEPVAGAYAACQPQYAYLGTYGTCGQVSYTIYSIGEQVSSYYTGGALADGGKTCSTTATAVPAGYAYFTLGVVVPPSTFVQATLQTDP